MQEVKITWKYVYSIAAKFDASDTPLNVWVIQVSKGSVILVLLSYNLDWIGV
jgi:hypothetical protein